MPRPAQMAVVSIITAIPAQLNLLAVAPAAVLLLGPTAQSVQALAAAASVGQPYASKDKQSWAASRSPVGNRRASRVVLKQSRHGRRYRPPHSILLAH